MAKDWTIQQLAPYIGRIKTTIAQELVNSLTRPGDLVVDPFCGSGVICLEAIAAGRRVIACDWNPYAVELTRAKLGAPPTLADASSRLARVWNESRGLLAAQDLRSVPAWVRAFFHSETLRSALAFRDACVEVNDSFLLACLLGILHHQRPGFLSYPSSHLVPYLRTRKFPRGSFAPLYEERDVLPRLEKKVARTYRRFPRYDTRHARIHLGDARRMPVPRTIDALVTSPPYMNELDYVRDNRLRLWFLLRSLPTDLELPRHSRELAFTALLQSTFPRLARRVVPGGHIALVLGDSRRSGPRTSTARIAIDVFAEDRVLRHMRLVKVIEDSIPDLRRSRRTFQGTKSETILIFRRS